MIKEEYVAKISEKLTELCEKHGVTANLEVQDYCDDVCVVPIPKDVANSMHDQLDIICQELETLPFIDNIYDRGATRIIRGDDYRRYEITVKSGCWTHTQADDDAAEEHVREYFDPEYAKIKREERLRKRRECWEEYIIPLPKPDGSLNTEVYLTMAYEPYDWIDKGYVEDGKLVYKRTEFRAYSEYYSKKLLSHPIKTVKFQRGYGGPGRPKPQQMRFEVTSITLWDPDQKLECDPRDLIKGIVPRFFAINLGNRI